MRLLGLDFETTGFDTAADRVIEIGACLWDTRRRAPIEMHGTYVTDEAIMALFEKPEISEMCARVSGIERADLAEFGRGPKEAFDILMAYASNHGVDYIVAHNGENFDKPLLLAELARHELAMGEKIARSIPWIDTRVDIPFPTEPDSRKLKHLALDCGFINPFPHRAMTDVLTMLRILDHYKLEEVIEHQKKPWILVRAWVSYEDRQLAKDQRYSWEKLGERTFPKSWVKQIKEDQLEAERKRCPFPVKLMLEARGGSGG